MRARRNWAFGLQLFVTLVVCAFLIVPVVQSILAGVTENFIHGLRSGLTLRWFAKVWDLYSDTIYRSFGIGLTCLAATLVLGVPAGYTMVKRQNRLTRLVEELLVTPLAVPGLAIALGMLLCYGSFTAYRMSWLFILSGHVLFTLPFMIRSVIAIMQSINLTEFEEGAASLGAGFRQRFFQIVIPNAMPGIMAGALMVLTLSIGEFNLTWMLHTPLTKTLPVGLADSYASMRLEIGSAYTIAFFIMIIPLLVGMQMLAKPKKVHEVKEDNNGTAALAAMTGISPVPGAGTEAAEARKVGGTSVRLVGCAKTFPNGTKALSPMDLTVNAGETVVLLGPSGCGKTTALRIIAGLESPDPGGRVYFNDEDVTDISIERRNVGMVFQSYALFPNMSVAENIAYGLKVRGIKGERRIRRVEQMLDMMQIGDLRQRNIAQLSGGQRQRVALARAIAVRPRLLLLDEPLTALDAKLRDALRVEIDTLLRGLGITAVYVTHDQAEAMALGDRIMVMGMGNVAQTGSPTDIYFHPCSRFVAEFIGNINRLGCIVESDRLVCQGGAIPLAPGRRPGPAPGEHAEVFFRPEHTMVTAPEEGQFTATLTASFFMGDRTRLILATEAGERLTVEAMGRVSREKGRQVGVRIAPESLIFLPE